MPHTNRLEIKALTAKELLKLCESPEAFAQELGLISSPSLSDAETKDAILRDLLPNIADLTKDPDFYTMWIVIEKAKKAIIGGICFHGEPNEKGEVEIGYGIDEAHRNQGFMSESILAMVKWLEENKKVKTILAEAISSNSSSIKVLEKNGFTRIKEDEKSIFMKMDLEEKEEK